MRIIISPAKKMNVDTDSLPYKSLPQFLPEAAFLLRRLRTLDDAQLQALWHCNDAIAKQNVERIRHMDLHKSLTPAILSYEGIQYQHMAPGVFEDGQFAYISDHLRILSGFYGLLRPFDGVTPYRLEMQARLAVGGAPNLYAFWGDKLAKQLCAETDCIFNLASKEYGRTVLAHLAGSVRFLTGTFGELRDGKIIEKGTLCKMARGEMVRWLAENQVTNPADIQDFDRLGYAYSTEHSTRDCFVFLKKSHTQRPSFPARESVRDGEAWNTVEGNAFSIGLK